MSSTGCGHTDAVSHAAGPTPPQTLLEIAVAVAREAARLIVDERPTGGPTVAATKSSATDIVTEMDRRAEALIARRLAAHRPDDGFLGEESGARPGSSGITWVVDPIDGTVNYLYEIPSYAVSIAARDGDQVVAGVVVNARSGEVWTASRGDGAFLDGRPVRVNSAPDLSLALIATGFGYDSARRGRQASVLQQVLPRVRDVRRAGAASLDLCAVACGRVDGYYEQGLKPWDLAAGGLIAQEAGARVAGLGGKPAGEALVLAAPPGLFESLGGLLESLGADCDGPPTE
jgi:myo-inositol-1(or 4)-monophosphatase